MSWILTRRRTEDAIATGLFALAAIGLFFTAPHNGEFWFSDSPRHALNGAFVKDLIEAMPADPSSWAMQYYVKYPALTILFYPPLFYVICAPFYAVFGVSHATALSVVLLHYFALALGLYFYARQWLNAALSIAVGLVSMAAPELALWGRQVMLDVPTIAFAVWAMFAASRFLKTDRPALLYVAVFLLLCAAYTRINSAFLFPAIALAVLWKARGRTLRDKHLWFAGSFAVIGMIPIVLLTLKFGAVNVQSTMEYSATPVRSGSLAGWLFYASYLPDLAGWPLVILAASAPVLWLTTRRLSGFTSTDSVLLLSWFLVPYVILSLIELKYPRYGLGLAPPILLAGGLALATWLGQRALSGIVAFAFVAIVGLQTAFAWPVPYVRGYREAAEWIASKAPPNANIVFSGERDGSFIWNMRAIEARKDISTMRADKLLLSVSVERERGFKEKSMSDADITALLDEDGVSYVVAQDDFWTDIPIMARWSKVLRSSHFKQVAVIPVVANVDTRDKILRIYKNEGRLNPKPHTISIDLPIVGRSISGHLGAANH